MERNLMMRKKIPQTKWFWALVMFGIIFLSVLLPPRFLLSPLRTTALTIAWPIENIFSGVAFSIRDAHQFFGSIGGLKNENARLQKENLELTSENAALRDLAKENETLRSELGLLPRDAYDLEAAEVVGKAPGGEGTLLINRGRQAGLMKDMPVIVNKGILIGRVEEVFPYNATITLLSQPASYVNGITSINAAKGIVKGEHGLGLLFGMVLQTDTLTAGESVVSSGLDRTIPKGLYIGVLDNIGLSPDGLYQQASLTTPVKFENLRYVFIIKDTRP